MNDAEKLLSNTCVLEIHVRQPSFRKRVNSHAFLHRSGNALGVDPDWIYVSKDLIEKSDLSSLEALRSTFLKSIKELALPKSQLNIGNGQHLIPLSKVEDIKKMIERFSKERNELLNDFESRYFSLKERARNKLGGLFSEDDWPPFSDIRRRYRVEYRFISNRIPEEFEKLQRRIALEERSRMQAVMNEAADEIRSMMRITFVNMVSALTETLTKDNDTGRYKAFPETKLREFRNFIENFATNNVLNDVEMTEMVNRAHQLLENRSLSDFKPDEARQQLGENLDLIRENLMALPSIRRLIDPTELSES